MHGKTYNLLKHYPIIVCAAYAFYPLCYFAGGLLGFAFTMYNPLAAFMSFTLIAFSLTAAAFALKINVSKWSVTASVIILPLWLFTCFCFILDSLEIAAALMLVNCSAAIATFIKHAKPKIAKILSGIVSALLLVVLAFVVLIASVFKDFGRNTVVESIASPDNKYTAQVIDNDQGALGGNTYVVVKNNRNRLKLFFGEFRQEPITVYKGSWGEYRGKEIKWKDEQTLVFGGNEYPVP